MKTFLVRLLSLACALLVTLAIIAFVLYARLPHILSANLSQKLDVPVNIKKLSLSPSTIALKQLSIDNLPGDTLPKALSIEETTVHAPLTHYLEQDVVIEEIALDHIYLGLEFDSASGKRGNWSILMSRLPSTEENKEDRQVHIKRLTLTHIEVEVYYKDKKTRHMLPVIDHIVLTDLDSKTGFPTDQIMRSVLGQMLKSVFLQENLKNMLDGILEEPKSSLETLIQPFQGLFK